MKTNIRLDTPFHLTGKWSLPTYDLYCQGSLAYDEDQLELKLPSGFPSSMESELKVQTDFERYSVVHGQSSEYGKCTLMKGTVTKRKTQFPTNETAEMEISGIHLFTGEHLSDHESQLFDGMTVSFTHLNDFVGVNGFHVERLEGELIGANANCQLPKKLELQVDAIESKIIFDQSINVSESRSKLSMEIDTQVSFRPDNPQNLDWFMGKIWSFNYLLTLLTDETPLPSSVQYSIPDGNDRPNGWLVYRNSVVNTPSKRPPVLLFYLRHLGEKFGQFLEHWFSASETMVDALHLFMNAKRDSTDHKARLLLLAHGLEAFSRDKGNATYMEPTDYQSVISAMNSAIPGNVVDGHRASLKNKIKFGNEHSLRKRLRGLLDELSSDTRNLVCNSTNSFINGIVDTRNYHSHYTDDLREKALNGVELFWACEKLEMMFRILLLKNMGVEEELIRKRISNHFRLGQQRFLWKEISEVVDSVR